MTTGHIVKILDFGLSKLTSESPENVAIGSNDVTAQGEILTSPTGMVGTLSYMSPEQARGDELDPRTDLFSLGAVIYEMASGQKAFSGDTPALILTAVMSARPPLIRKLRLRICQFNWKG